MIDYAKPVTRLLGIFRTVDLQRRGQVLPGPDVGGSGGHRLHGSLTYAVVALVLPPQISPLSVNHEIRVVPFQGMSPPLSLTNEVSFVSSRRPQYEHDRRSESGEVVCNASHRAVTLLAAPGGR